MDWPFRCRKGHILFSPFPLWHEIHQQVTIQNLPRVKITKFNCSPLDLLNFFVEFREVIHERPCISGSQRMSFLIQSLSGDAKRSVIGLSNDWEGYVSGLKRLMLLFGQRPSFVHTHMEHIMQEHVKDSDMEILSVFYYSLNDCVMSLQRLNFNSDIYFTKNADIYSPQKRYPHDMFTKLDSKDCYWHVKLTEESSYLTTFTNLFGRCRCNRLPFCLCVL